MSSTRKLFLVIHSTRKYTIHSYSIHRTIITKSVQICKIKSVSVESNYRFSSNAMQSLPSNSSSSSSTSLSSNSEHHIVSILSGCRSLKDCYEKMIHEKEYLSLLNEDKLGYTNQHHKYFILKLINKASKDKYLSWQMVFNIIQFYSKFHQRYQMKPASIYNFLSILSRRGDFDAVTSIIEHLSTASNLPQLPINSQLFTLLIQALRIGGQSKRGYHLFEQCIEDFDLKPSIQLLLQGYMVCICARM